MVICIPSSTWRDDHCRKPPKRDAGHGTLLVLATLGAEEATTIIKQIAIIFALVLVVTAGIAVVSFIAHLPPPGCSARC